MGKESSKVQFEETLLSSTFLPSLCSPQTSSFFSINFLPHFQSLTPPHRPLSIIPPNIIEKTLQQQLQEIIANNKTTGNINMLIIYITKALRYEMNNFDENKSMSYLVNSLVVLRFLLHDIICVNRYEGVMEHFKKIDEQLGVKDVIDVMIRCFVEYLGKCKVSKVNVFVHYEVLNVLVVLFSTTLYYGITNEIIDDDDELNDEEKKRREDGKLKKSNESLEEIDLDEVRKHNVFIEAVLAIENEELINIFVKKLLNNSCLALDRNDDIFPTEEESYSWIYTITSFIFTIPSIAYSALFGDNEEEEFDNYSIHFLNKSRSLFSSKCLYVLELLLFYKKSNKYNNRFLTSFRNMQSTIEEPNFISRLFQLSIINFSIEEKSILLYLLINDNKEFFNFVIDSTSPVILVLPIIKKLYECDINEEFSDHIWILVIVLIKLTQNQKFNIFINDTELRHIDWYKEKRIEKIKLSSLITLVLLKIVQTNVLLKRKLFGLNENCLCVIGNLSTHSNLLHIRASQKIFDLIKMLMKKVNKIEEKEIYISYIQKLIEIVNSVITYKLPQNLNLVYQMLLDRDLIVYKLDQVLESYNRSNIPELKNLKIACEYFYQKNKEKNEENKSWTVKEVIMCLREGSIQWNQDLLSMQQYRRLNYSFDEDENVEEFFIPYVWSLIILNNDFIDWEMKKVKLDLSLFQFSEELKPKNGEDVVIKSIVTEEVLESPNNDVSTSNNSLNTLDDV